MKRHDTPKQQENVLQCLAIDYIISINPAHRKIKRWSELKTRQGIPTLRAHNRVKRFFCASKIDTMPMVRSCGSSGEGMLLGPFSASEVITWPATIMKTWCQALTQTKSIKL